MNPADVLPYAGLWLAAHTPFVVALVVVRVAGKFGVRA